MLRGSYRFSTFRRRSQLAIPSSVSATARAFSSTMKSPFFSASISESLPSVMVAARRSFGMIRSIL